MVLEVDERVGLDFSWRRNWLGLRHSRQNQTNWSYTATIMARTEVLGVASRPCDPIHPGQNVSDQFPGFSAVDERPPEPPSDRRVWRCFKRDYYGRRRRHNLLVMDMDLCIRCGTARWPVKVHGHSRAPTSRHTHRPPVKPKLRSIQHVLMPSVCLHCQDPNALPDVQRELRSFAEGQIDRSEDLYRCADARPVPLQRYFHGAT